MIKSSLDDIINDLRSRRDCLSLAHESIKKKSDQYNKTIIVLSLVTGSIESTKIKMGWNGAGMALIPIFLSSIIGMVSALAKFEGFPEKMETLVQAISLLTNTLTKARNHTELDEDLLAEYHSSLQANESSLYPDIRKTYLRQAHKNLLSIMACEQKYYYNIKKVNAGEKLDIKCDSDSDSNSFSVDNVLSYNRHIELESGEKKEETMEIDISQSPKSKRTLPLIKEVDNL
jgi:hypothetical protein